MAKILIVDDSATEIYKLINILEKNSHSVLSAALPCCDR
jgi:PleD family two-component response regulator